MTRGVIGEAGRRRAILVALLSFAAVWVIGVAAAQPAEEGTASLYGDRLEGKKTASGETYDRKALAAAHPKYAFGTRLRVTNLANGKSAVVVVNDRMKRSTRGVIEVTPRVAQLLGFARAGTARVSVEVVR